MTGQFGSNPPAQLRSDKACSCPLLHEGAIGLWTRHPFLLLPAHCGSVSDCGPEAGDGVPFAGGPPGAGQRALDARHASAGRSCQRGHVAVPPLRVRRRHPRQKGCVVTPREVAGVQPGQIGGGRAAALGRSTGGRHRRAAPSAGRVSRGRRSPRPAPHGSGRRRLQRRALQPARTPSATCSASRYARAGRS